MILQLNPQIPMHTDKGDGYALAVIDYGQDHSLLWVIALNDTGEIWTIPNEKVRITKNYSMGRMIDKSKTTHLRSVDIKK